MIEPMKGMIIFHTQLGMGKIREIGSRIIDANIEIKTLWIDFLFFAEMVQLDHDEVNIIKVSPYDQEKIFEIGGKSEILIARKRDKKGDSK